MLLYLCVHRFLHLSALHVCVCVSVGEDGLIKGWTDSEHLNMSKAVKYNADRGIFTVERTGVYFLYCQVSLWE